MTSELVQTISYINLQADPVWILTMRATVEKRGLLNLQPNYRRSQMLDSVLVKLWIKYNWLELGGRSRAGSRPVCPTITH